jgi:type II secretory ATPase GspE/PulE/Tfp pilus assembly ATPase PilB-like protein
VIGVITQRLVRVLCDRCKRAYSPPEELLQMLGAPAAGRQVAFYRPEGCDFCGGIGYRGRTGLFEIMVVDETLKSLVTRRVSAGAIKAEAMNAGMRSLAQDGVEKAMMGLTSPEEVLDAVGFEE